MNVPSKKPTGDRTSVLDPEVLKTSGALLSTQIAISKLIDDNAVSFTDFDPTTLDLLVRLDQAPGNRLRAVEISRQLLLSPSHISRSLDKAQAAGLLSREPDPDDRRASQVVLSDKGREVITGFAPHFEAVIDHAINQALNKEEREILVGLLERINAASCLPYPAAGSA